ncbi:MAG: hypothetical protein ACRELY_07740 [Polyangiaceae bacterium]
MMWQLDSDKTNITKVEEVTFAEIGMKERSDLQRLLRSNIGVISPRTLVIAEEYGDWEESRRRIDLLGLDDEANFVVIELKRTEDGGHMDLQAVRYAAMISAMTFAKAVQTYEKYLRQIGQQTDAEEALLDFLDWESPRESEFGREVRIVLASAEFSKELTTSVLWLNEREIDIRCVRVKPYRVDDRVLIDVQQVIPLPETAEYQVQLKQKAAEEKKDRESTIDFTRYDLVLEGKTYPRLWKRGLIHQVVRAAVEHGAAPDDLSTFFPRGASRWLTIPGTLSSPAFIHEMSNLTGKFGASRKSKRYFVEDDELFHIEGNTWALSNQWSGVHVLAAIEKVSKAYPKLGIGVTKSADA